MAFACKLGAEVACVALACMHTAQAQSVALTGVMCNKALLIIEGNPPKAVGAGDSYLGVKVISVTSEQSTVESSGKRYTLELGATPTQVNAAGRTGSSNRITLIADSVGHFSGLGSINGKPMQFLVDTGATEVSIGAAEAENMGLDYRKGQRVNLHTANGTIQGWRLQLSSVRIGETELQGVSAIITPQAMPYVLLGNSFLNQFQMTRTNNEMVLERRF